MAKASGQALMTLEFTTGTLQALLGRTLWPAALCALMLFAGGSAAQTGTSPQKLFPSPEAAVEALVEAMKEQDQPALREMLGRRGVDLVRLRDPSADARRFERFLAAYQESNKLVPQGDARTMLEVGKDAWPFPIPLVEVAGGWRFDTPLGEQEVLARRIGRNELAAIQVCLAIADAEHEYASVDWNQNGEAEYALRLTSRPGKRDGLYWESSGGEPLSPLGPLVAAAGVDSSAQRVAEQRTPYHGYYYRILTQQGKNAKGGARSYIVHGRMIGGFAVLAYPARYGYTGVKSFILSHDGEVYERDLGKDTASIASRMRAFDPDPSWTRP
jgi:hypothetical protein